MFSEKSDYLKGESFFVGKILCTKTGALKGEPVFVGNIQVLWETIGCRLVYRNGCSCIQEYIV